MNMKTIPNFPNYVIKENGDIINIKTNYILKPTVNKFGYKVLNLRTKYKGKISSFYIHRLVAQAFIPNPNNKPQVNHKDGNKLNNNVENLEWCNNSENSIHAFKLGLRK